MGPPPRSLSERCNRGNTVSRLGPTRVCIVTQVPAPYREPLFQRLACEPNIELKVFYFAKALSCLAWQPNETRAEQRTSYDRSLLPNFTPPGLRWLPVFGYANCSIVWSS